MATLNNDDFTWIKNWIRGSSHKDVLKVSGLSKAELHDTLQAVESWETGGHVSTPTEPRNDAMETAAGQTLTLAVETGIWLAWAAWKAQEV